MHILIDAIAARLGGNITVLRNLLSALVTLDGGRNRYSVFGRRDLVRELEPHERVHLQTAKLAEWNLAARLAWEQIAIPAQSAFGDVDVVFAPSGLAVFASAAPQVLMFQNAAPFDEGVLAQSPRFKRARLLALQKLGVISARAADRVVFISNFERDLLSPKLGISADKSQVIYLGREADFVPSAKAHGAEVLARYGINAPYMLSVSHFYHYKNIVELVRGFAIAAPDLPPEMRLVLAGAEHEVDYSRRVRETVRSNGLEARVDFLGNVPRKDLPALYASATTFVFPSQCESFPNILIESLSSGVPTLASRAGPMPELAGDAARYFDGTDPKDIAASMVQLAREPETSLWLAARGQKQAARYSWEQTATALLKTFDDVARPKGKSRKPGPGAASSTSTAQYFGGMADTWGARYGKSNFSERREIVGRWLQGRTPGRVVDLGCGSGQLSVVARDLGWNVTSLDLSPKMLQAARGLGLHSLAVTDAAQVPLRSASADAMLSISMLEYVPRPAAVISEFARILRPGGTLLISIPNRISALRRVEGAVAGLRKRGYLGARLSARFGYLQYLDYAKTEISNGQLIAMLDQVGLKLEESGHFTPAGMAGNRLEAIGMNSYFIATRIGRQGK
jgi:glycosyltransferase involved in cell wall biosynthesis/SAM-dependent methyltransferase